MRNAFLAAVAVVACLNSYFCNKAVNNFRLLSDEALKLAAQQYQRVKQLEQFIADMGLPVPAEDAVPILPPTADENVTIDVY